MDWRALFFSPEGRLNRQNFWIGVLIIFAANLVLGWIPLIGFLVWAVGLYASICINSKRLHDMGKSGWLQLIPIGIAVVLMVIGMAIGGTAMMASWAMHPGGYMGPGMMNGVGWGGAGLMMGAMSLAGLVGLIFLLWVGLTPGEPSDNRYGPPAATATPAPAA
jgi:uncharacterized membrane protein YhaH (DUF805 family)